MSISRRGLIAAGLAVATAATVGFASITAAGASQINPADLTPPGGNVANRMSAAGRPGQPVARYAPKGRPGATAARPAVSALAAPSYLYGVARQVAISDGTYGTMTVAQPKLADEDFHSLGELAVQSADSDQIVEIGWTVDRSVNGDDRPHLFVYHWVDGVGACYNGCGFVQHSAVAKPGMALPVNAPALFAIQHFQAAWWVMYGGEWVGYFPDTLWGGRFTKAGLTQWFGEVAASSATPCTDMGTGAYASSAAAATVSGVGFFNGPGVNLGLDNTSKAFYTTRRVAGGFRFGGPGAC